MKAAGLSVDVQVAPTLETVQWCRRARGEAEGFDDYVRRLGYVHFLSNQGPCSCPFFMKRRICKHAIYLLLQR